MSSDHIRVRHEGDFARIVPKPRKPVERDYMAPFKGKHRQTLEDVRKSLRGRRRFV